MTAVTTPPAAGSALTAHPSASVMPLSRLDSVLSGHRSVQMNISRADMITAAVEGREALVSACGALATWTPAHSTGRIPKDTYMVRDAETEATVDWSFSVCNPMLPETFDALWADALTALEHADDLYVTDRCVGADPKYALPVRTVSDAALTALFTDNMFRALPAELPQSVFVDQGFALLVLPHTPVDVRKYEGVLRRDGERTVERLVAMDFERRLGIIYGSSYCGCVKKLMFTAMNYLLPAHGILPLHCSANEDRTGTSALFLGLSGTGKTTLSNDPSRALIGDDEHGWSDDGIANLENGCYAKMINLDERKEPEIYRAVFTERPLAEHGCIVENAVMFPSGAFDLADDRYTENSRASYPFSLLTTAKGSAQGGHPQTIVFLTADASGVLPPVARLTAPQAMFWFMMGYTSKLAGTETGVTSPVSTFSRFFGGPFMPRHPRDYARLLGEKMQQHGTRVYLVNTGWSGGPYGTGRRVDIDLSRKIVQAVLQGTLSEAKEVADERFHFFVPQSCPNVDPALLNPRSTWADPAAYDEAADALAAEFAAHFEKEFGHSELDPAVREACPGR